MGMADSEKHSEPPVQSNPTGERRQLLAALMATDHLVGRIDRFISTTAGQERAFAGLSYLSHALHHLLASAPWIAFQTRLSLLARLKQQKQPPSTSSSSSSPLLALSSLFSETRYTLRLFGLVPLWTWGSQTLKNPPKDLLLYALTLLQIIANVLYQ